MPQDLSHGNGKTVLDVPSTRSMLTLFQVHDHYRNVYSHCGDTLLVSASASS